jgi:O-antigen ligase
MWAEAIDMIRYNPLLGIGSGHYAEYTGSLIAHNTFIQAMGETGLVGLFVFLALLYSSFKTMWIVHQHRTEIGDALTKLNRVILVSFVAYLAVGFFIVVDFETLYVWMALTAIPLALARRQQCLVLAPRERTLVGTDLRNVAVATVGFVVLIKFVVQALSGG